MAVDPNTTQEAPTPTPPKPKRQAVCKKTYLHADETEHKSASPEATSLRFTFANGETRDITPKQFQSGVRDCATFHGLSQTLGDTYAGVKGSVDDAVEAFDTKLEVLMAGVWVKDREGVGPRPSMVAEAVRAALEKSGETVDDTRMEAIREKLASPEARKGALANPVIAAAYETERAKRAIEKAQKADKAAEGATLEGF